MPEINAKDIKHGLTRFVPRPGTAFRTQTFKGADGKDFECPFFLTQGKKVYFKHPTRPELDLTDDVVLALFADEKGNFAQAKSSYFIEVGKAAKVEKP